MGSMCLKHGHLKEHEREGLEDVLKAHAALLQAVLDGTPLPACVEPEHAQQEDIDEAVAKLLIVAKGLRDEGMTVPAFQLLAHLMQQFPVQRIGTVIVLVECLMSVLRQCKPGWQLTDELRHDIEALLQFGVIDEAVVRGGMANVAASCRDLSDSDDIPRAQERVIASIGRSVVETHESESSEYGLAEGWMKGVFAQACEQGNEGVVTSCIHHLGKGDGGARALRFSLKKRWKKQLLQLTMQRSMHRMEERGWTLTQHASSSGIRCEWVFAEGRRADQVALLDFLDTAVQCGLAVMPGMVMATLKALQASGLNAATVAFILMMKPHVQLEPVVLFLEGALASGEFKKGTCSAAEVTPVRRWLAGCWSEFSLQDGDVSTQRLFDAWKGMVEQGEEVSLSMLGEVESWDNGSSLETSAEDFLRGHLRRVDSFSEGLFAALGDDTSLKAVVEDAFAKVNRVDKDRPCGSLQTRRNLLAKHFKDQMSRDRYRRRRAFLAVVPSMQSLHALAACFPDDDASVADHAAVMSGTYAHPDLGVGALAQWLQSAAAPDPDWHENWCALGMEPGARRLDLLSLAILRLAALSPEKVMPANLGAHIEAAFSRHSNAGYRALCKAAAFVEILECCPNPPEKLAEDWRMEAERLLGKWRTKKSSEDLPIVMSECDAWARRLVGRLND